MAVDPLQPDRAVADNGVDVGGGGEMAAPGFLVPAAPDDPERVRVGCGIGRDLRLRLGEAPGAGKVELEGAEAELHDMAVGVDQPGKEGAALAVEAVARAVGLAVAALDQLDDLAVVADPDGGEADEAPLRVEAIAVDIVDEDVGEGGAGPEEKGEEGEKLTDRHGAE